jgi:hypothetical protein
MRLFTLMAAIMGVIAIPFATLHAEDTQAESEHCIPLQQIRKLQVLDNRHIVFQMQMGKNYLNTLPRACPGLRRDKPVMYKTSITQLCSLDIINVLESYGGGYQAGAGCGLGVFTPASDGDIKALKASLKKKKE